KAFSKIGLSSVVLSEMLFDKIKAAVYLSIVQIKVHTPNVCPLALSNMVLPLKHRSLRSGGIIRAIAHKTLDSFTNILQFARRFRATRQDGEAQASCNQSEIFHSKNCRAVPARAAMNGFNFSVARP